MICNIKSINSTHDGIMVGSSLILVSLSLSHHLCQRNFVYQNLLNYIEANDKREGQVRGRTDPSLIAWLGMNRRNSTQLRMCPSQAVQVRVSWVPLKGASLQGLWVLGRPDSTRGDQVACEYLFLNLLLEHMPKFKIWAQTQWLGLQMVTRLSNYLVYLNSKKIGYESYFWTSLLIGYGFISFLRTH